MGRSGMMQDIAACRELPAAQRRIALCCRDNNSRANTTGVISPGQNSRAFTLVTVRTLGPSSPLRTRADPVLPAASLPTIGPFSLGSLEIGVPSGQHLADATRHGCRRHATCTWVTSINQCPRHVLILRQPARLPYTCHSPPTSSYLYSDFNLSMDYSALRETFKRDAWTDTQERVRHACPARSYARLDGEATGIPADRPQPCPPACAPCRAAAPELAPASVHADDRSCSSRSRTSARCPARRCGRSSSRRSTGGSPCQSPTWMLSATLCRCCTMPACCEWAGQAGASSHSPCSGSGRD